MASKRFVQACLERRFTVFQSKFAGLKQAASVLERFESSKQVYRRLLLPAGRNCGRSNRTQFTSAAGVGSSLALMGFFKKEEKKLSEHDQVRHVVSEGIVAKQNRDVKLATTKYHEALNLTTDFFNENKISENEHLNHRVFIYDQMANLSLEVGQYKQAEELFIETMRLALRLGMKENDNAMIEMSMKVAIIHRYTGRRELASKGLLFCISEQEKKLNSDETKSSGSANEILNSQQERASRQDTKVLLGKAYQHYAHYFMQDRDFKNAVKYSTMALEIASETLGPNDETTFVLINDLATCQIMLQNYDDAEKVLKDGIKKSRKLNSVLESAMCSNLGALYIRTNRLDEAESTCKRGLKVAEKHYDSFMMGPCQVCLKKLAQVRGEEAEEEEEVKK